jgi:ATP-dependent protease Clp ATPase subunit
MGFKADLQSVAKEAGALTDQLSRKISSSTGMIPEFVGRLPVVGTLHELDKRRSFRS